MATMVPTTSHHLLDHVRPTELPFGDTQTREGQLRLHPGLVATLRARYAEWREARRRDLDHRWQGALRGADEMR